jgi:small subunit ribosomal protein S14
MKSLKQKDFLLRKSYNNRELLSLKTKILFKFFLTKKKFHKAFVVNFFLKNNVKKVCKTKIVRRCLFTNRSRVSNRLFGISRIVFRDLLTKGLVPGFKKAIW